MYRSTHLSLALLLAGGLLTACSSASSPTAGSQLTVIGAAFAPPPSAPSLFTPPVPSGDPAALRIGVYALYISSNADCSSPVLVQDYGATAVTKDFVANPVLFTGSPADGSYPCVAIKMSDVIRMEPDSSFGNCVAGTEYAGDIYRAGETDWKDVDLNPITGTGTDSMPSDDRVTLIMTRDTAAAIGRGFSPNQTIQLGSDLIVPSQSTFYWNGQGSVVDQGGQCGINPGQPSFQ
jgi:hypothetical protein